MRSIVRFNGLLSPPDGISVESILSYLIARLLSASAPHAASWLTVMSWAPFRFRSDSGEVVVWALSCALCPGVVLGHHAATDIRLWDELYKWPHFRTGSHSPSLCASDGLGTRQAGCL